MYYLKEGIMISIIIPLYNKQDYIRATLDSIFSQSFQDFEVVVVNDGSTDKSLSVVNSYRDKRLRVFDKENGGVSRARNFGYKQSKGDWVMFLDADDTVTPNCLSVLYQLMVDFPSSTLVCANYDIILDKHNVIKGCKLQNRGLLLKPFKELWDKKWNLRLGAYAMQRHVFDAVGGFCTFMKKGEDVYFNNEVIHNSTIAFSSDVVMSYNREGSFFSNVSTPLSEGDIYYQRLEDGEKYEKLVKAEIVWKGICYRILHLNISEVFSMQKKYKGYYCLIVESFVRRICKAICPF